MCILGEGVFMVIFGNMHKLGPAIVMLVIMSIFLQ